MSLPHLLQANFSLTRFKPGHEPPAFFVCCQHLAAGFKFVVQIRYVLPKVVHAPLEKIIRNELFDADVIPLNPVAGFTDQDQQLTHHIQATQVDARIGFRIALFLCHVNRLAKRNIGRYRIEDKIQGA